MFPQTLQDPDGPVRPLLLLLFALGGGGADMGLLGTKAAKVPQDLFGFGLVYVLAAVCLSETQPFQKARRMHDSSGLSLMMLKFFFF